LSRKTTNGGTPTAALFRKIESLVKERMRSEKVLRFEDLRKQSPLAPARILIIEDDDQLRKALLRVLADDEHQIVVASDARHLQSVVERFVFDLILLDVGLPWIDGFELAKMMKEHPDMKAIPLVFISGHRDMDSVKKGFAVGADDYIMKPFDLEKLRKTVQTLLYLSRS
jgi:two-component system, OmpR family, aerobic respiration control protein ArcA